ncbi:hypothetical protein D2E26_1143 [Bifidobacterium dolichotidis]|uniref:Uncharacterized protein n=1 Tax=Bifidobacterium dolichotidis TaxID=2306976 RepID=A0A430FQH1_9BIFI|nr:hypothetical protein [Bifidobacterium dolichotidis]RSX55089.1 hypothetical protein D2E26_1143 [Bifidobacterium dolichotidis]
MDKKRTVLFITLSVMATVLCASLGVLLANIWTMPTMVLAAGIVIAAFYMQSNATVRKFFAQQSGSDQDTQAPRAIDNLSLGSKLSFFAICLVLFFGVYVLVETVQEVGLPSSTSNGLGSPALVAFGLLTIAYAGMAVLNGVLLTKCAPVSVVTPAMNMHG